VNPYWSISHVGIFVFDVPKMMDFYTNVLGFVVTDEALPTSVFLSRNPEHHHQILLMGGRQSSPDVQQVQQISFKVGSLAEVREMHRRILAANAERGESYIQTTSHGNAWSVYFRDPEGNRLECFVDTPWHVQQPCVDRLDFALSDEEIVRFTEEQKSKRFWEPRAQWAEKFVRMLKEKLAAKGLLFERK
jgi:catechol 2,3-dioxygenase